ncbi:hypothetical protein N8I77_000811 [Diaporthe amygdali]|uniref:Uncharacterized protein n=1 Tax=Phomopsis amygdali TaxID=1214568 RepID=A0AAD9SPB6_PHOAM|nr:uncharacterized protein J7T55_012733 [Diaporthe amygdali]KAJ0115453.1 hypothetical protein J7T55_012733 [Diaporthe amygdali]KAK2613945.1 hypothetical protein N8I77_000811 [Diaporthe amygdali]
MVSIKSLAVAALAAAPTAMGYITNLTAPAEAAAGSNITATLQTAIYSQNWVDFGIIWGLAKPEYAYGDAVGTQVGYTTLTGREGLEYPYTFTAGVSIPETFTGDYVLRAAIPYLVGASGEVGFTVLSSNITIS